MHRNFYSTVRLIKGSTRNLNLLVQQQLATDNSINRLFTFIVLVSISLGNRSSCSFYRHHEKKRKRLAALKDPEKARLPPYERSQGEVVVDTCIQFRIKQEEDSEDRLYQFFPFSTMLLFAREGDNESQLYQMQQCIQYF